MDCWARINGKDYPISYGWTLTEEFSETLDSASIILPHVREEISLKPYDDVIIHDFDPKVSPLPPRPYGVTINEDIAGFEGHFYRHMLVGSFTREQLSVEKVQNADEDSAYEQAELVIQQTMDDPYLTDEQKAAIIEAQYVIMYDNEGRFEYTYHIELVSETKGLETVQLPNKTISQPIGTTESGLTIDGYNSVIFPESMVLPCKNTVNVWNDGYLVHEEKRDWITWERIYVFAGDMDSATSDFSVFGKMKSTVYGDKEMSLPDWNISGVQAILSNTVLWNWMILEQQTFYPKKHWIIVKRGINDGAWVTRQQILDNIHNYLNGIDYSEIVNEQVSLDGSRDIRSEDAVSSMKVKFPSPSVRENYTVYLYVEPQNFLVGYSEEFNVFGMVKPNHKLGKDDEFLACWNFSVVSSETYQAKDVLTVYEAVRQAIDIYSPYVKLTKDGSSWQYVRKYSIADETKNFFSTVVAPENQWNTPNLRDFITRLFYVADCIPVVKDNVIHHICLSQRKPDPFVAKEGCMSYENYSMDGSSYCDRLLRTYSDGLSKDNVTNCVERLGFKNGDSALLTLENLRLELSHPIYRINKVYMCYYNKYKDQLGNDYMRLCKQDITPLILLNAQRNLLSEDWNSLDNTLKAPSSIQDLAKFKYATIGYDIGSRYISGWGMKYTTPSNVFWTSTKTVIENIFEYVYQRNLLGVYDISEDFAGMSQESQTADTFISNANDNREALVKGNNAYTPYVEKDIALSKLIQNTPLSAFFGNYTQRLKSLMFIIDYQGYISSAVLSSKDFHDGNIVSRDNASSSLSFVESDGINQKEKANRLGNATLTASARYVNMGDIQDLAQVWDDDVPKGKEKIHNEEVLFKRTIAFNKDYFSVSYYFCRNFILRNYFTSVYARHRPFPLASYEESVERMENKTLELLLSPDKAYWQDESKRVGFSYDVGRLVSFFTSSEYDSRGKLIPNNGIDTSYYCVYPSDNFSYRGQSGIFAVDNQKFISGNSLCFAISMKDNVSAGVFVSDFNHNVGAFVGETITNALTLMTGNSFWDASDPVVRATNILTGAKQDWFMFPVDPMTGMLYSMSFGVGFGNDNNAYAVDKMVSINDYDIASAQMLPLLDVVLERKDKAVYFGQEKDGYAVGLGYPRLKFVPTGYNGKYKVNFDGVDGYYSYSQAVIEKNEVSDFSFGKFVDDDNVGALSERNAVTEFLYAKFVGSETEGATETETCVFKDGKERVATTIQIEPVSEDRRIAFSSYMMKLSDAMGGKEKNYSEKAVGNNIVFMFGVSQLLLLVRDFVDAPTHTSVVFSVPSLTIGLPKGTSISDTITINKTWVAYANGTNDSNYSITLKEILSTDEVNHTLSANIEINFGGITVEETAIFRLLSEVGTYIDGRTGNSDFITSSTCFDAGIEYDSYCLCEDGFFNYLNNGTELRNTSVRCSNLAVDQPPFDDFLTAGLVAPSSLYATQPSYNVILSFYNALLEYGQLNYINTSLSYVVNNNRVLYLDKAIPSYSVFSIDQGPAVGESTEKAKTMYWCYSNDKLTIETQYETLNKEPENPLTIVPNENVYISKTANGIYKLNIDILEDITGSIRLYYRDNGVYHFVFGINVAPKLTADQQRLDDFIYPENYVDIDQRTHNVYGVYLSFLDDRSKTVINDIADDARQGDPSYKVANYLDSAEVPSSLPNPSNICVAK